MVVSALTLFNCSFGAVMSDAEPRSLMAELLYQVQLEGGVVPSATTDGFVCDIADLENKLVEKYLNNQAEKSLKELTIARLEIESTINKGEVVYSKISKLLNILNTG